MAAKMISAVLMMTFLATALATGYKKDECWSCKYSSECITNKCWGGKCVYDTEDSKKKCFFEECALCKSSGSCITLFCFKGKCVYKTKESREKCFPELKPTPSSSSTPTATPTPSSSSTPTATPTPSSSSKPVLKKDCEPCTSASECETGKCTDGLCGNLGQVKKCPKDLCEPCRKSSECKSEKCWDYICTDGTYETLLKCGYNAECEGCHKDSECATEKCEHYKCIFDTAESRKKCFH